MPHKSFIAAQKDDVVEQEPTTFDVGGKYRAGPKKGEDWVETFTCLDQIPAGVLDDLTSSSLIDRGGNRVYNATSLTAFFEGVLIPEDEQRFRLLIHDKARVVEIEHLGEIMEWLSVELVGSPTKR